MGKLKEKLPIRGSPFTCKSDSLMPMKLKACTSITIIFNYMMIIQLFIHTFVIKD